MKKRAFNLLALTLALMLLVGAIAPASAQTNPEKPETATLDDAKATDQIPAYTISPSGIYLVRLADAPLASYQGGVAGLAATSPRATGGTKLDVNNSASLAYREYLAEEQAKLVAAMEENLGHSVEVLFHYDVVYNGMAMRLTPGEAADLTGYPGVVDVRPDFVRYPTTDVGPTWIGAPKIWDGSATGGLGGTKGEGMIVGVIDTGINFDHPSFADIGGDGYNHTNPFGAGNYKGWCDPANVNYDPAVHKCNDKLVGAWDYTSDGNKGEDDDGHGSHTASTAAGNVTSASIVAPTLTINRNISGVAPHANIIAYDTCISGAGCPGSGLIGAINQAVIDGVDVINYSIGGGPNDPWNDADSQSFLAAREAGVFVATSAGNDGPAAYTMGSPANAPWLLAVGASTHNRQFANALVDMSGGSTPPPPDLAGQSITSGYGPAAIVHAKDFGDALCLNPFSAGTWSGEIVVCDRGENARVDKGYNVLQGGAGGFVLANTAVESEGLSADAHYLPAVHLGFTASEKLRAWLGSGSGHMATIAGTTVDVNPANGDIMADFSSRGPNLPVPNVIKPDVTAPGVAILAASMNGVEFESMGGTSMASPHAAGSATLLKALHPAWTDAEIQSAMMMTAFPDNLLKEDGQTPADPFDYGAGRIDLSKAGRAALVLDETAARFTSADPGAGGDPRTLNLASMADDDCQGTCSWRRTVENTLGASAQWTATVVGASPGLEVTVTPDSFTLQAGNTRPLDIQADVSNFNAALDGSDSWGFAWLKLESAGQVPLHMPIAVKKNYSSAPLLLTKEANTLSAETGEIVEYTIDIQNHDSVTNTYSLVDSLPEGVEYVASSATGGLVYDSANRQFTWSGDIGPGSIDYAITPVDHIPYLNLADVGSGGICTTYFPTDCDDKVLAWDLGTERYTFYGETLSEVDQSSNSMIFGPEGWLGSACSACPQYLPEPTEINQVLAGLWRDTHPGFGGTGEFYGALLTGLLADPGDKVFYGNWHNVGQFGNLSITTRHAIAIVLDGQSEPAGRIYYIYDDITGDLTANGFSVGVEDKVGGKGVTYGYAPCTGGSCIPHAPEGSVPAEGTTLRLDQVVSGDNYRRTFTYQVRVTAIGPKVVTNQVQVTSNSVEPETQSMWAQADLSIEPPDLYITKSVNPRTQDPGGVVTYTILFGNDSGLDLTNITVSDTLPAEVEYASSNPPGTYDPLTHDLVWDGLTLNSGDHVTATVVVTIAADATPAIWITNRAYLYYGGPEPYMDQVTHLTLALDNAIYLPLIAKNH